MAHSDVPIAGAVSDRGPGESVAPVADTLTAAPAERLAPARAPQHRTRAVVGGLLIVVISGYIGLFALTAGVIEFRELAFAPPATERARPLDAYIDVLGVDPVRETLHLRIHVGDAGGTRGERYFSTATRDVNVRISDGTTEQDVAVRRTAPLPATLFDADLQGSIRNYPFDRFVLRMLVSATATTAEAVDGGALPLRLTVWDGEPAWNMRVVGSFSSTAPGTELTFQLDRRTPLIFFACAIYGVMILLAVSAVTISTRTWIDPTRAEATLIGALGAMVFALPALRNSLPGSPPLGVGADIFIFLWAELAVAASLAIVVAAWVRKGRKPRAAGSR